jgi:ferredoxin
MRYLKNVVTLKLDGAECTGCLRCLDVCPHAVLAASNGAVSIVDRDACMECGACSRNCPAGALSVSAGVGCAYAVARGGSCDNSPDCC